MNNLNYIYVIIFMVLSQNIHAQKLVEIDNQWNIATYPTFSPNTVSYSIRIGEDTVINNTTYSKVFETRDSLSENWYLTSSYLRQDSAKRVFIVQFDGDEVLLYDFSLEINDTFLAEGFCTMIVNDIDSVILNNGEVRKRLKLSIMDFPDWGEEYWIDGIGSNYGLLSHFEFCATDYAEGLLCFYSNSELLYPDSPFSCFITPTKEAEPGNLKVYPNPVQDILFIEKNESTFKEYIIYDITGKVILNGTIENINEGINLSNIQRGFYVLLLRNNQGGLYSQKLIKG